MVTQTKFPVNLTESLSCELCVIVVQCYLSFSFFFFFFFLNKGFIVSLESSLHIR